MTQTTNYGLNIVEGNDVVNPLVQTNPNFQRIDEVMKANEGRGIATATEVKSGTNHAITRNVANAVFKFVATSDFRTGDTFSVDGTTVTATLVDGTLPKDRAFVVGTSVLCILDNIRLTFVNCESSPTDINASDINYDNSTSGLTATKVQGAIDELRNADNILLNNEQSVSDAIDSTPISLSSDVKLYKCGKLRTLYIGGSASALTSLTIPLGDRPSTNKTFPIIWYGWLGRIGINSNGTITVGHYATYGSSTLTDDSASTISVNAVLTWAVE